MIIAAHAIIAIWLVLTSVSRPPRPATEILASVDLSANVIEPDAPAKPAVVPPVADIRVVPLLRSASQLSVAPATTGSGEGTGCSMVVNAIGAAVLADKDAMAELADLPIEVRSDADAVMLWNGAWLDVAPETAPLLGQREIFALKRAVTEAVESLPAGCRQVENAGPRLIAIPEQNRTTMLVIGSGVWRWATLTDPTVDAGHANQADQPLTDWLASWGASGN